MIKNQVGKVISGVLSINMSLKHLAAKDPLPPLKPGLLRLYSMKFCPYAQLARLTLAHKNIQHEIVNVHLKNKPQWFLDRSPLGTVPCLETPDGALVWDSGICLEYLDAVYPQNKLIPDDPLERAVVKMWMERYTSKTTTPFFKLVFTGSRDPEDVKALQEALKPFENLLHDGRDFFGGKELNLLDIRMWPNFEKVDFVREKSGLDLFPSDRFPKLTAWRKRMQKTPAAMGGSVDLVNMAKFDLNNPDYDAGVEL